MDVRRIKIPGITYIDKVEGTDALYWGMDYTSGDLYEAEELFRDGHPIRRNRLIFISYPEGEVFEPIKAAEGQYLGRPVFFGGRAYALMVDFPKAEIRILRCADDMRSAEPHVTIPLGEVHDCYNLMLATSPLTLVRQGHENRFQVVWPDKGDFPIAPQESLDSRNGDDLIFSKWYMLLCGIIMIASCVAHTIIYRLPADKVERMETVNRKRRAKIAAGIPQKEAQLEAIEEVGS